MQKRLVALMVLALVALLALPALAQDEEEGSLEITLIGSYETGIFDEGAAEIGAYDAGSQRLFVTNADANTIDILDLSDPTTPTLIASISFDEFGGSINSVAVYEGLVAAAIEGEEVDSNGSIVFTDIDGSILNSVEAGVLPDMVAFSPDGTKVVSANEGEPSDDYSIDPEGSISVVDLSEGVENATVTTLGFGDFNTNYPEGIRVFGPDATLAQDLEPEYVAISPDSTVAFVTLQENNALAGVLLETPEIGGLLPLGFKDYSLEENAIDASNEDGAINIQPWPVFGMYQPDAIAAYEVDGVTYLVTANEGDARDYDTFSEEARIADVTLDPEAFPNAEELQLEENLGRLLITTTLGDTDGDGDYDALYNYGARSFTIWDAFSGEIVFDSVNQFETITAELLPEAFNSNGTIDGFDGRSDDKGPEPEGVVVGEINGSFYAFIGLERIGGVMVYDVTVPAEATFVTWVLNSNPEGSAEEGTAGDIGPEGLVFVSADDSPTGLPLLIVTNEVSGSVSIFEINAGM